MALPNKDILDRVFTGEHMIEEVSRSYISRRLVKPALHKSDKLPFFRIRLGYGVAYFEMFPRKQPDDPNEIIFWLKYKLWLSIRWRFPRGIKCSFFSKNEQKATRLGATKSIWLSTKNIDG